MKTLFLAATAFLSTASFSQTKKIAFESHSGSAKNFSIALSNELFDNEDSDFGLPSSKSKYKLDSVIYISEEKSLMVSKHYSAPWEAKSDSQFIFKGITRDTIYNTSLLSKKNSADSIRNGLKGIGGMTTQYEASSKTVFIGFGKAKAKPKEKEKEKIQQQQQLVPLFTHNDPPDNSSPFDPQLMVMLGSILLLSIAGGFISWKLYKPQHAVA